MGLFGSKAKDLEVEPVETERESAVTGPLTTPVGVTIKAPFRLISPLTVPSTWITPSPSSVPETVMPVARRGVKAGEKGIGEKNFLIIGKAGISPDFSYKIIIDWAGSLSRERPSPLSLKPL